MRNAWAVLVLGMAALVSAAADAGEHAGGAEKIRLVSTTRSPEPWSPALDVLSVNSTFEVRPTDAGGSSKAAEKEFVIRFTVDIRNADGETVAFEAGKYDN